MCCNFNFVVLKCRSGLRLQPTDHKQLSTRLWAVPKMGNTDSFLGGKMEEIQKFFPGEINHGIWAEGLRHGGGMEKIKKSTEKKKPVVPDVLDEHTKTREKLDIIRQTHIRMFHDNMSKSEMNKQPEARQQREQRGETKKNGHRDKKEQRQAMESEEINTGRIDQQALVLIKKPIRKSSGNMTPQGHDVSYLMRLYLGAETGIYKTKDDVKVTVFKDPKSKLTYLTFLIPLNETESEEVSVFLDPEKPEKASIFDRSVKKK